MWLTDGQTDRQTDRRTDRRTDGRHTIIRPKFYFGRIKMKIKTYGLKRFGFSESRQMKDFMLSLLTFKLHFQSAI